MREKRNKCRAAWPLQPRALRQLYRKEDALKVLNPKLHGYIDYAAVLVLALAPTLFGIGGIAATLCYVMAAAQLSMSLITAYPMSVAKIIPFTIHGGVEVVVAVALVAAPWLFGFAGDDAARNFFVISGIALAFVYALTNYRAADKYRRHHGATGGAFNQRSYS
jgi:hypothetical protein